MKRIVRLTESDLVKLVRRVINEQSEGEMANAIPLQLKDEPGFPATKQVELLVTYGVLTNTKGQKPTTFGPGIYMVNTMELPSDMTLGQYARPLKTLKNYMASKRIGLNSIVDIIFDKQQNVMYQSYNR